eukprot:gnl/TRDRNA2_/TRDRNA2_138397_c0_seq2.p1 gnl/TRDRNA2_/TRDRNA2_138397_c0~~gnl/TRDRNA2_/TRDRNA2_138397_c0_seq2.p1  ORF type:complete len:467 (-),score=60.83 gnl/TRDRNA2_/TRDRNA2_138397_c0_seq2:148-1548(-)
MALQEVGWKTHLQLATTYFAAILVSGLLGAWPILMNMYMYTGLLGQVCIDKGEKYGCPEQAVALGNVYSTANGICVLSWAFIGPGIALFGNKLMGVMGACMSTLGVALTLVCLEWKLSPGMEMFMVYAGTISTDIGSGAVRLCILAFTFHYPTKKGMLTGLQNSAQQWAIFFALLMLPKFLAGTPLKDMFLILLVANVIATVIIVILTPGQAEYAERYNAFMEANGVATTEESKGDHVKRFCKSWYCNPPYNRCNVAFNVHWLVSLCSISLYAGSVGPFMTVMFGAKEGLDMSTFFAHMSILNGAILSPVYGYLSSDVLGPSTQLGFITIAQAVWLGTAMVPSQMMQTISIIACTVWWSFLGGFIFQFPILYLASDLVGFGYANMAIIAGAISTPLVPAVLNTCAAHFAGKAVYTSGMLLFLGSSILLGVIVIILMVVNVVPKVPPPEPGSKRASYRELENPASSK